MASNYVIKEESYDYHPKHHQHQAPSPRGVVRRSSSSSSSSCCSQGVAGFAAPKCVCAPATHAGSFKCRLHRTNPQGYKPLSPTTIPAPRLSGATAAAAPAAPAVEA